MKIQVVKQGSKRVQMSDPCPYFLEVPPEAAKK
jgi:hypothetical protein